MMDWLAESFAGVTAISWRTGALILAFIGLRWFGRRWIPTGIIFAGWVLIAVRMLAPFSMPAEWSPYRLAGPLREVVITLNPAPPPSSVATPAQVATSSSPVPPLNELRPAPTQSSTITTATSILAMLWIAGVAGMLTARGAASYQLNREVRRTQCDDDPRLLALLSQVAQQLGIRCRIHTATSTALNAPAIAGLWRPRLLIPAGFAAQLSDEELRFVLRHELGHWRRRDLLAQTLLHVALAVHWFNPLAWLAVRLARRDCEFACDEFVLRSTPHSSANAYGATLLKALGTTRRIHPSPAALGIFENKQQLKRRIEMIIGYKTSSLRRALAGAAAVGLVALGGFTHEIPAAEAASEAITTEAPKGWFENGSKTDSYVVGVDSAQKHVQPFSAYVKSSAPAVEGFGGMMQTFSADDFRGKRVRFSAWVKTQAVPKGANLWMRIDAGSSRSIRFDNMSDRPVKDTTDWTACSVVLDVPAESTDINFGFFITGSGQAWVNDAKFEVVGAEVATTGKAARKAPENLAFNPAALN
jgi:bla regulator protein blaR1